jgi:hypothetical protein
MSLTTIVTNGPSAAMKIEVLGGMIIVETGGAGVCDISALLVATIQSVDMNVLMRPIAIMNAYLATLKVQVGLAGKLVITGHALMT